MSRKSKNVIVAQSGGPSAVINNSLRGVVETCGSMPEHFETVYGAIHGIEGVLKEELIDLSCQDLEEIRLLRTTPAAGVLGSCRYRLPRDRDEDLLRVTEVFKAHNIGYFFYIGGNDSMDTAQRVASLASEQGLDLVAVGVPKTIDNDIGDSEFKLIDHTPGYGSAARYWCLTVQSAAQESAGSYPYSPVLVLQAMGRKIGFLPAAARLADPERRLPLLLFLCEADLTLEELADRVNDKIRERGRALVVISEGFEVGRIGGFNDAFGHTIFAARKITAGQVVINYLNEKGLAARGVARLNVPCTEQSHSMIYASTVDLDEAYGVACHAVRIAVEEGSGYMATILRVPGPSYSVYYDKIPLEQMANSERSFPKSWLTSSKVDVTDEFIDYGQPLIGCDWPTVPLVGGRQRFTRLKQVLADQRLPAYVPQSY